VELTKVAKGYAEEARVAVRNVRRHGMDEIKKAEKDHAISTDQYNDFSKQIQALTDAHIKKVDDALANKEKEILQV
jgi:ribosome recycling factor